MTCVAWDGKILAADSQITGSYIINSPFQKIIRVDKEDKVLLVTGCGELQCLQEFMDWVSGVQEDKPEAFTSEIFSGLVYDVGENIMYAYESRLVPTIVSYPYASGTGGDFAMGAMKVGASARLAVEAAISLDASSGGNIVYFDAELIREEMKNKKKTKKTGKSKRK